MGDLEKRGDDSLTTPEDDGGSNVAYWVVAGLAVVVVGILAIFLWPWLLAGAGALIALWIAWRIIRWWNADDESEPALITDDRNPEDELDSEIALEDLRQRAEHPSE